MPAFIWKNNVTGSCNMARVEKLQVVPDLLRGDENNSRIKFDAVECECSHTLECLISISDWQPASLLPVLACRQAASD